ncbi:hypothetical protein [Bradyrhizobium commune]|uniref:Uncharacterized protein n=1 Tax=Bradyrhizobium commune TaxID=83627 RepID=A0A7S9D2Y5_9BRAD|nr:hypothetical protein [Bradyrhizobium commune]QPF90245.1 hypothetical protein IC761_27640 [Bradyrhizobium commune]
MVAFATEMLRKSKAAPDFKAMRCTLLLEGTPVTIQEGQGGVIVTAETVFGKTLRGVSDLTAIDIAPTSP